MDDKTRQAVSRISELIENKTREEFETAMFPRKESMGDFKELIKYFQNHKEILNSHPVTKIKLEIMTNFFTRLVEDGIYDPKFDRLHQDPYKEAKKIDQGKAHLSQLKQNWDLDESKISVDVLCQTYAFQFERFCKKYIRPLASKISKQKITKCGIAIQKIIEYDKNTEVVINPCLRPQIRNSIDHADYYFNKHKMMIVFENENKPPLELKIDEMKNLIRLTMENEMCFSTAEFSIKEPLLKAIIVDTEKVLHLCNIKGIDFDNLLDYFLKRGFSIFEISWALERL